MTDWQGGYGGELDVSEVAHVSDITWVYRKGVGWVEAVPHPDELLPQYRRWLYAVAYGMGAGKMDVEDLAQEGYIAMWRALKTYDPRQGAVATWITNAAKMRMRDMLSRGREFGHEARRGTVTVEDRMQPDSLEQLMEDGGAEVASLSHTVLDNIVNAYHHGDIVDAINRLPALQRRYVVLRFWSGMDTPGIAAALELTPRAASILWTGGAGDLGARARLAADLAHLAGAV